MGDGYFLMDSAYPTPYMVNSTNWSADECGKYIQGITPNNKKEQHRSYEGENIIAWCAVSITVWNPLTLHEQKIIFIHKVLGEDQRRSPIESFPTWHEKHNPFSAYSDQSN